MSEFDKIESLEIINIINEVGKKITASLVFEEVLENIYENINKLMDANVFGIAMYDNSSKELLFKMLMEDSIKKPLFKFSINNEKSIAARVFISGEPLYINNFTPEIDTIRNEKYDNRPTEKSVYFLPLYLENEKIGIITIQSYRENAYNEKQLEIVKALSTYISIALNNSMKQMQLIEKEKILQKNYKKLEQSQMKNKETMEMFLQLFSDSPIATAFVDLKSKEIIRFNNKFKDLFKFNKKNVKNVTLSDLFVNKDNTPCNKYQTILEKEKGIEGIIEDFFKTSGVIFHGRYTANVILYNALPHLLFLVEDISREVEDKKEIERLNKKNQEELEQIVEKRTDELKHVLKELMEKEKMASLGGLVSGVAHEINTPLGTSITSISFMDKIHKEIIEKLKNGALSKKDLTDYLNLMSESISIVDNNLYRASELVKSFKKISSDQTYEIKTKFNLKNYTDLIILSLKHELKHHVNNIIINIDSSIILNSYPGVYSQIITNLIMNSLIHGFKDGRNGDIIISCSLKNDECLLTYSDNGLGISDEVIGKVFDPFFTTNRNNGGNGLGLNIVYNLITGKLNGSIKVQSVPNSYTKFLIKLPINS
jgi:PAS domain S-box-containing protein